MTKKTDNLICPNCHKGAKWVPNEEVHGRRYGVSYMCWYCKDCDFYVGCHQNTRKPLGTMVGKNVRNLRMQVHTAIDWLWQEGVTTRKELYRLISKELGYEYHTGEADEKTCKKILSMDLYNLLGSPHY